MAAAKKAAAKKAAARTGRPGWDAVIEVAEWVVTAGGAGLVGEIAIRGSQRTLAAIRRRHPPKTQKHVGVVEAARLLINEYYEDRPLRRNAKPISQAHFPDGRWAVVFRTRTEYLAARVVKQGRRPVVEVERSSRHSSRR